MNNQLSAHMFDMGLNDRLELTKDFIPIEDDNIRVFIRRTISGWTYEYYDNQVDEVFFVVFVPFASSKPCNRGSIHETLHLLNLNQIYEVQNDGFKEDSHIAIRMVPGGWLYEYWDTGDMKPTNVCFMPEVPLVQEPTKRAQATPRPARTRRTRRRRPIRQPGGRPPVTDG